MDIYGQAPFACRLQWGPEGARRAAAEGHIVIIVDVLVFSTSAAAIVQQGGALLPVGSVAEAKEAAARYGARDLPGRAHPTPEGWSHSPASLTGLPPGMRFVYTSANGAACCAAAAGAGAGAVLAGGLVNATAAARAAAGLAAGTGRPITVVPCGERWEAGSLRPALEDELGAGAIIAGLSCSKSVEAMAAEALYRSLASSNRLQEAVWDCASGRELRERCFGADVSLAARLDCCDAVPMGDGSGWLLPSARS